MVKKNKRYFDKSEEKPSEDATDINSDKIITFDISDIKPKHFNKKKKQQNNPIVRKKTVNPKYRGKVPVSKELLNKYSQGKGANINGVRTIVHQKKLEKKEHDIKLATEIAARAEILLTEESGFLEADDGETTTQFTQKQIVDSVDITSAAKQFDLSLDFGPYKSRYTRNGRHLVLGGKKGHVAAFDWVTKKLHCEFNVMESVHDVCFLHVETMMAVAQKDWVYIYDNQGIELHCIKRLNKVTRMEFLPYHFLLSACSDEGYLSWLDVSIGKLVSQLNTRLGRLSMLAQNPWNAILCVGHAKGVVSMWSPNSREPLAKMLCHKAPITALHVDPSGMYMATSASNRELKIWDVRNLNGPLQDYKLVTAANHLNFSQKKMLGVGMGNVVEVYRDCCTNSAKKPYLRHRFVTSIESLNFCPYEDVLGVSTSRGFTSLLVPGSGEPNFDGLEANPFQTKSQRREAEVKSLLEKIQPELITLQPTAIGEVDVASLKDKVEARNKLLFIKPKKIDYQPRNKAKGKGGTVNMHKNKKILQGEAKKEFISNTKDLLPKFEQPRKVKPQEKPFNILERFVPKKPKV
ncbi:unnamed protein product [Brassicogethes aeneus]|uniref:BING4 C-terminal domain-containing protein n=1 Tax=Brassicogethes aeneus TaxID=1431903 RepID=A0A9P0FA65_BRAAE|nr:unnamed protein product [Brassicogethes aeneus]